MIKYKLLILLLIFSPVVAADCTLSGAQPWLQFIEGINPDQIIDDYPVLPLDDGGGGIGFPTMLAPSQRVPMEKQAPPTNQAAPPAPKPTPRQPPATTDDSQGGFLNLF